MKLKMFSYNRSGSFRPWVVLAWVISANFGAPGRFGLMFLSSPRLWIIGRTIIWLFDVESSDVKGLLFKSLQVWGDISLFSIAWLVITLYRL